MLGLIFVIVLSLLVLGTAPLWPYSRNWGYRLSILFSIFLLLLIILIFIGYIPFIGAQKNASSVSGVNENKTVDANDRENRVIKPEKNKEADTIITPETKSILAPDSSKSE